MRLYLIQRGTRELFGYNAEMAKNPDLELYAIDLDTEDPETFEFPEQDEPFQLNPTPVRATQTLLADTAEQASVAAIAAAESGQIEPVHARPEQTITLLAGDGVDAVSVGGDGTRVQAQQVAEAAPEPLPELVEPTAEEVPEAQVASLPVGTAAGTVTPETPELVAPQVQDPAERIRLRRASLKATRQ